MSEAESLLNHMAVQEREEGSGFNVSLFASNVRTTPGLIGQRGCCYAGCKGVVLGPTRDIVNITHGPIGDDVHSVCKEMKENYVGGAFKAFSLIKALRLLGMDVVLAGSQTDSLIFTHESGIHCNGMLKDPRTYEPFSGSFLGRCSELVTGKHSGKALLRQCQYQPDISTSTLHS